MKKYILAAIALIIAIGVAIWFINYNKQEPNEVKEVKVGYLAIGAGLPIFVAEKNGYFDEQGLDVQLVEFKTSNDVAAAGLSEQIDVVGTGATNAMLDANSNAGGKFQLFLLNNYVKRPDGQSTDFVLSKNGDAIKQFSDFKGKTVAIFPGSVGEVFLKSVAPKLGLKPEDLKVVSMAPPQWMPALESGSIDGVFGAVEPFATQMLKSGTAKIVVDGYYAELMPAVPASGAWFIENRLSRDEQARFYAAIKKATLFIRSNEAEARTALGDFTPTPKDQLTEIRLQDWRLIEESGASKSAQDFALIFHQNGGISQLPATDSWLWKP
jgi:NitT/TauT family transport system substrate-binding protein